jgi:hypothetical protein
LAQLHETFLRGSYDDAIRLAHEVLRDRPRDEACLSAIDACRKTLEDLRIFSNAAGHRVPVMAKPMNEVTTMALDHRAGFVLSLIDGGGGDNVEDLVAICPMPRQEALAVLFGLVRAGAVKMR